MLNINTEPNNQDSHNKNSEQKKKPRGRPFEKGNKFGCGSKKNKDKTSLESYIQRKTNDGKKMANFYIGIIDSINRNKDAVCCEKCGCLTYNGIRINGDLVKEAHSWLTLNGWGRPSARDKPVEEPEMTREEAIAEIKSMLNDRGLKLVDINSPSPERIL